VAFYYKITSVEIGGERTYLLVADCDSRGALVECIVVATDVRADRTSVPPSWTADGRRIYYIARDATNKDPVMAVDLVDSGALVVDERHMVLTNTAGNCEVAVSPDGKVLAVIAFDGRPYRQPFIVWLRPEVD
jgi:Tol biopolymer transport system component